LFPIEKNKDHFSRLVAEAKKDKTVPEEDKPTSPKGSIFILKKYFVEKFREKNWKN
jgi:hypothetical protein